MARYYDYVLGMIPLALGGVAAALMGAGLAVTTAITVASVFAVGLIGHAMFVNGPVDERSAPTGDESSLRSAD